MHYHEQLTFTKYWKYFFYKFITCFQNILFGKWGWYSILKTYHSFRNRYFLWNRIFSTYMRFFRRKVIYPEQMKPVCFSDDLSFEKKNSSGLSRDYWLRLNIKNDKLRFPLKKKVLNTRYAVNFLQAQNW